MINLQSKQFTLISNSAGDAKPGETIFTFEQHGCAVRSTYSGGGIELGAIVGQFTGDSLLKVFFQQVTSLGKLCGGEGEIRIQAEVNGKLRFIDDWCFTANGEGRGQAIWQEL